jgi:hypothetical protein
MELISFLSHVCVALLSRNVHSSSPGKHFISATCFFNARLFHYLRFTQLLPGLYSSLLPTPGSSSVLTASHIRVCTDLTGLKF